MTVRQRTTKRKALIERIIADDYIGGPVLLEELRWKVLTQQYGPSFTEMTDAKQKSFARTIREHTPQLSIQKISIDGRMPVGLIARAAVYRQKKFDDLHCFLNGENPCVLCRYQTNVDVDEPRYDSGNRLRGPALSCATFRFFAERPTVLSYEEVQRVPGTFIPTTQKLSLVCPTGIVVDLGAVAAVPWKLFGYEALADWHEVDPLDQLSTVKRNRY